MIFRDKPILMDYGIPGVAYYERDSLHYNGGIEYKDWKIKVGFVI